jgi:hypothetical protein
LYWSLKNDAGVKHKQPDLLMKIHPNISIQQQMVMKTQPEEMQQHTVG